MPSSTKTTNAAAAAKDASSALTQKYQKKTDKEHVLHSPDTYTGTMDEIENEMYCFKDETGRIARKTIKFIPGLYKLFDEGIVNCRDHVIRMAQVLADQKDGATKEHPVSAIEVAIEEDGTISFKNDGNGIDVVKHPEYDIWIPEMIFAHLRTGTNYNKAEKKTIGGKNGFGAKLIFIWSSYGKLETVDHKRGLKFVQEYGANLDEIGVPKITKCKTKPYTRITFKPDFARMKIPGGLTTDVLALFKKRVYDISAVTDKSIKVKLNGALLPTKNFQSYIDLYIGEKAEAKRIYESPNDRWEYAVALTPSEEFEQVSFVNGICTSKGGKHVEYILNQIVKKMVAYIAKKKKVDVKPNTIKEQLMLFVRCDIENPNFDSQTKDFMTSPVSKFGSSCAVSDAFIDKVAKMGIMNTACELTSVKNNKVAKKTDGSKVKSIRGIPKLVDANFAGTAKSAQCTIIFCEGDSAKAGILSGLSKEDRNFLGVYPMKGKMFNVRDEPMKRISENKEFTEIKQILGLETNRKYATLEEVHAQLRYGKILFMTDQDLDGSHIKGLGINLFESLWESLVKLNVIGFMNTPILKAKKGAMTLRFYNDGEYKQWKASGENTQGWNIKYYKGLGTSTGKEFKEYFKEKKVVMFQYDDTAKNAIDLVFNKKRADDRKAWLGEYDRDDYLDTNQSNVTFSDFIDREMRHFSKYDCDRSIPNLMDGLKISQRKILYAAFKKNLTKEIKVAQFSGYVSEHSGYHHGEASLNGAIVGMAQNFVGSNNINLFVPNGQFGTRLMGGKDSASERYIFTQLNAITKQLFNPADNAVLNYLDDDGFPVEPVYYAPILPMILVNGAKGIGTGFSTDIMSYNPAQLKSYIKKMLHGGSAHVADLRKTPLTESEFVPHYNGFRGTIVPIGQHSQKYLIKGVYEKVGADKLKVTELPVGQWTDDYKQYIEQLIEKHKKGIVKDYSDMSTDQKVEFVLVFAKGVLEKLASEKIVIDAAKHIECTQLEKNLKLYTTHTTTNMYLFDAKERLRKYRFPEEMIWDYYDARVAVYNERIAHIIGEIQKQLMLLTNKAKYISENLEGTIDLRRKKKDAIDALLADKGYDKIGGDYKYLVKMPMDSVCEENVEKLMNEKGDKEKELEYYQKITAEQLWFDELENLKL